MTFTIIRRLVRLSRFRDIERLTKYWPGRSFATFPRNDSANQAWEVTSVPRRSTLAPPFDVSRKKMKKHHKVATAFALLGIGALLLMIFSAAIEVAFGQTFEIREEIALIWTWAFIILPLFMAILLFQPRVISFAAAVAIPIGLGVYGAITHIPIHTEWYFWLIVVACIGYVGFFLLRCLADDRRANQTRHGTAGNRAAKS